MVVLAVTRFFFSDRNAFRQCVQDWAPAMAGWWWCRRCGSGCSVALTVDQCSGLCCNRRTLHIADERWRLWCWGLSIDITQNDVIIVRGHDARPHGDGCAVPFVVGKAWTAAGSVARNRLLKGGVVVGVDVGFSGLLCSGEDPNALHSSSSSTRRIEFFVNILPVVLHVPGVEEGHRNDFTERWLVTRKGFLYEIEVWPKYIGLVMVAPDNFSQVGLK